MADETGLYNIAPGETPQATASRRKIAEALLAEGMSTNPIKSPWQGIANLAKSLIGGYDIGQAEKQDATGRANAMRQFQEAVAGPQDGPAPSPSSPGMMMPGANGEPARPKVASSATVMGDDEAMKAGLYDMPSGAATDAPGAPLPAPNPMRSPVANALSGSASQPAPPPQGRPPVSPALIAALGNPYLPRGLASVGSQVIRMNAAMAAKKERAFHILGYDQDGKPKYGWVGQNPGEATPYELPRAKVAEADAESAIPANARWAQLTGDDFLNAVTQVDPRRAAFFKQVASGQIPYPSQKFIYTKEGQQLVEDLAQYEPGIDATKFRQRQTYRNQLASGSPASVGGQRNLMGTSLGHLAELADSAVALGNYDTGLTYPSYAVNAVRGATTEQSAKARNLQEKAARFSGEIGRLYSGAQGGGVHEREETRSRFGPNLSPQELAGALQASRDLIHSKLYQLEQQRDEMLGAQANSVEFLGKDQKASLAKIDEAIAKLKTGATSPKADLPEGWTVKVK